MPRKPATARATSAKKAVEGEQPLTSLTDKVRAIQAQARERQRSEILASPQLPLWPEAVRSLPNEIVRSALFNARNRRQKREYLRGASIIVIGDGSITYTGEELRQDDETVWLQLIHQARNAPLGSWLEFTPYSFCKEIGWPIKGQSYDRLRDVLTRLQATSLKIYSSRLGEGVGLSMIPLFNWKDEANQSSLPRWRVQIAKELVLLFGDVHYTRVEWEQRKSLPDGLATWLHSYFASHRDPYPIKIETIKKGAGLTDDSKNDLKKTISRALEALKGVGFLSSYEITGDLVSVKRA